METMLIHLHFFGFGDPLCRFSLEQRTGLHVEGFRPLLLDELLGWSQRVARHQHWDIEPLQQMVINRWMEQEDQIRGWQKQLTHHPAEVELVAGLGSRGDWQGHWNAMLRVS